jgi:hypothetical protein
MHGKVARNSQLFEIAARYRSLAMANSPRIVAIVVLAAVAWLGPHVRHRVIHAITFDDAVPTQGVTLPRPSGAGLAPADRVRVVLVDGLADAKTATM